MKTSQEWTRREINRTLNDAVRSMLSHSSMPDEFWAECLITATDVRNCIPKESKVKVPFGTTIKPNVSQF